MTSASDLGTLFSPCRTWRYTLERHLTLDPGTLAFVCLNPSTADEQQDDPTVRRCAGYARRWGYGRLVVLNIFAYRSTDPKALITLPDPVGPDNDRWIELAVAQADMVVAAWGAWGHLHSRGNAVRALLAATGKPIHALGLTRAGEPRHPLYLRADTPPERFL